MASSPARPRSCSTRWRWCCPRKPANSWRKDAAAIDFVANAWAHLKAIAWDAGAAPLLKAGNVGKDAGVVDAGDAKAFIAAAKTRQWAREPKLRRLA